MEIHPTDLRQKESSVVYLKTLGKTDPLSPSSLLEYRQAFQWLMQVKTVPKSPVKVHQLLLQYLGRTFPQKAILLGAFPEPEPEG